MGTRSSGDSPRKKRAMLAIAICNARSTPARLPPARCGVTITWGKSVREGIASRALVAQHVECCPPELATHESATEGCFVEQLAA